MLKTLLFLSLFFSVSGFSQTYLVQKRGFYTGNENITVVDNSQYYRSTITRQGFGSCAIHAPIANLEAAIKRFCPSVKEEINIDELYYIYVFLKLLNQNKDRELTKKFKGLEDNFGAYPDAFTEELVYKMALGLYGGSEEKRNETYMCLESGKVSPQDTQKNLNELMKLEIILSTYVNQKKCTVPEAFQFKPGNYYVDKPIANEIKGFTCSKLDQYAEKCWFPTTETEKSTATTTNQISDLTNQSKFKGVKPKDSTVIDCLKKLKYTKNPVFTHKYAKEILDSGGFFSCNGGFYDEDGAAYGHKKQSFGHALNVVGYQFNPKTNLTEYLVRDSNYSNEKVAPYIITGCNRMFYVELSN